MEPIRDLRSPALLRAMEENFRGWEPLFEHLEGARVEHPYGCIVWTSAIPLPFFNGVIGAPVTDDLDAAIDDVLARFDEGDIPLMWAVPPPHDLTSRLAARGFEVGTMPGMALDLSSLPDPSVEGASVSEVDDDGQGLRAATEIAFSTNEMAEEGIDPFLDTLGRFPERSRMRTFLATVDGIPAATSTLFASAGVAALYNVGTLPGFRGRGLGSLISVAAMATGRALGYRVGVLQASEMGEPLYRSLGFEECCRYTFAARGSREPRGAV
jgi:GNAT superfamily N-acetyltransferase